MTGKGSAEKNCLVCNDIFRLTPKQLKIKKYCSWKCRLIGMKGWQNGSKNNQWKGDRVGYRQLHAWVQEKLGKAPQCVNGHISNRYCWGNISGQYKRDLLDWKPVCWKCNYFDGVKKHFRFKVEAQFRRFA